MLIDFYFIATIPSAPPLQLEEYEDLPPPSYAEATTIPGNTVYIFFLLHVDFNLILYSSKIYIKLFYTLLLISGSGLNSMRRSNDTEHTNANWDFKPQYPVWTMARAAASQ